MSPDVPGGPPTVTDHKAGLPEPGVLSRVRDADRATRKPLALWDRLKFLLLLGVLFLGVFVRAIGLWP